MQFMVPNKLFRVAKFAWKLGYYVCKCIKLVYTCQKKNYKNNRLNCCRPNKINK